MLSYSSVAASEAFTVGTSLTVSKTVYVEGEDIVIDFVYSNNPGLDAWVSLWPADSDPQALPSPSAFWNYICSDSQSSACGAQPTGGAVTLNADSEGSWTWPITCGSWKAYLIASGGDMLSYSSVAASKAFTVGGAATCENEVCNASPEDASPTNTHLVPSEGAPITKVAFGSCYKPDGQTHGSDLWQHVRNNFGSSSVWNWLGDNMYQDTNDSQAKRNAYNTARSNSYYTTYGPIAEPKIPTTGTWDDHDYGIENYGNNYECRQSSQNEFVYHFNVPDTDPRHPAYGGGQQEGIYSAYMFQSDTGAPGIHLINLDARYHRSPTFTSYGSCEAASSTMLGATQWSWLENELNRPSEVKIIGSGTQVLPPTHRGRSLSNYCAYDGTGNTFDAANLELGEGPAFEGTNYEAWAEIPQERTRMLKLVQESINAGNAKQVIFISGDQHWAEMMVKEIPSRSGQAAVSVYEVTGSGIDQKWPFTVVNTNRLRPEDFGFGLRRDLQGLRVQEDNTRNLNAATAIKSITYSGSNTCSGDSLHICSATANYGGIEVDWANQEVHLSIFTPFEIVQEAVRVTLNLGATSAAAP